MSSKQTSALVFEGVQWRITSSGLKLVVQLIVAVILARLLGPRDLGLLGLAVIVASLVSTISEVGIGTALVQRTNVSQTYIQVGFTLSLIAGILATVMVWTVAPIISGFFQNAEMTPMLRLLSLCHVLDNLGIIPRALLLRRLDFKRQFWADASGNLIGYAVVSIGLTLLGYGVWGPAIGLVVGSLVTSVALLFIAPVPGRLRLAYRETWEILRFGFGVSLTMFASYAAKNADYFVVGRWLGIEALGYYRYAYQIAYLPTTAVTAELSFVLFPALSVIMSEPERLQSTYRRALVVVSVIVLPASIAIAISAPELVPVVLGNEWAGSILPLQILCVGGLFRAVYNLSGALATAAGVVYQQAIRYMVYAVAVFGGSLLGMAWGLTGVSSGVVAALALISILMSQLSIRFLKRPWRWLLGIYLPVLLVALGVGVGGGLGTALGRILELSPLLRLAVILLGCLGGALGGVVGIPMYWLSSDDICLLTNLAHRIPYERVREWVLWKVGERRTAASAERWVERSKSWVRRRIPAAERTYRAVRLLWHLTRHGMWSAVWSSRWRTGSYVQQRVLTWDVPIPPVSSPQAMENWLRAQGMIINPGENTMYLPPQERLNVIFGDWVHLYPPDAGIKILRDLRPPDQASYQWISCCCRGEAAVIGTPSDQLLTTNFLYASGLSPRVYDLCCLRSGSAKFTAFVVRHIAGRTPDEVDAQKFLARLITVLDSTDLKTVHPTWHKTAEFIFPTIRGNLLVHRDTDEPLYVDFQPFRICDTVRWRRAILDVGTDVRYFGDEPLSGWDRSRSRSIVEGAKNGNGDMTKRSVIILDQLRRQGFMVEGRLILHVGCNIGIMMAQTLYDGALWSIGWDLPAIVRYTEPFLLSLGLTRFSLIAVEPDGIYRLWEDVPDSLRPHLSESVVFLSAGRQHRGVMDSLLQLPWRVVVYEGVERENLEDLKSHIAPLLRYDLRILSQAYQGDELFNCRPLAIVSRA